MSYVTRFARAAAALATLTAAVWLSSCSDNPGGPGEQLPQGLIVSDPVLAASPAAGMGPPAALASAGDEVAYVSLPPGTVPPGSTAIIRRVGSTGSILTAVFDGGFDPVPVDAGAGDSIDVIVRDAAGGTVLQARLAVAARRPPVVVRTEPPRKKTDVPLNAAIVVVFSEPVAEATLSASSVRLFRGPFPVAGTVRLLQGTGAAVAFIPTAPLARNTDYRLVVTRGVRDLDGDALEAGVTVAFTTGQSSTGPAASITVSPDTVRMTGATYQMTATVRDAAGNVLIDQPITWATSDPTGLTVSPTGLLTALAAGFYTVTATVNGLSASVGVFVLAGPAASLEVTPPQATVGAAGDTIILTAVVRDASGRLLDRPPVTWTSSDAAVATVAADSAGNAGLAFATVTGVNPGSATVTAALGTPSATVSVTVIPAPPVASVTVTPELAFLVRQGTVQLSAAVRDPNGKVLGGRPVTWTTDNPAATTVDANGLVTGVSVGAAGVIATREGKSDTAAVTVVALSFASTSSGGGHTCGLTSDGAAFCWGANGQGQLGDGTTTDRTTPVAVQGGLSFTAVSAGGYGGLGHTCGVTTQGAAYCWGYNEYGRLGDGTTTARGTPRAVQGGLSFAVVSAGGFRSCGLTANGAAYCWGGGPLGDGSINSSAVPVAVSGGLTFSAITAGAYHTCGLTTNGAAYCWGSNWQGELGNGDTTQWRYLPVAVSGGLTFSALSANSVGGADHTCGVTIAGAAYCWGWNHFGQLGDSSFLSRSVPTAVTGGLTLSVVIAGAEHTCGLATSRAPYCWGRNDSGQLGTGTGSPPCPVSGLGCSTTPVAVAGGLTFASLSTGRAHSCGVTTAGITYCWGNNGYGQLGDGTTTSSNVPVKVAGQP